MTSVELLDVLLWAGHLFEDLESISNGGQEGGFYNLRAVAQNEQDQEGPSN